MQIRPAAVDDLAAIQAIYALEVLEGTASFETEPPDLTEIARRFEDVRRRDLPWLAAESEGAVLGYAYVAPYRARPAYAMTVETSIYLDRRFRRQGVGSTLLEAVVDAARKVGMRQAVAVIGDSANEGSIRLHARAGFRMVGTLTDVGFKFGRFLDTVIMQKSLLDPPEIG